MNIHPKSHPNKFYSQHLDEIWEASNYLLNLLNPPKKKEYEKALRYIIFYHDLFKLTKEFQESLEKGLRSKINHAQLAGLFLLLNKELLPEKWRKIVINIVFYHHSFPKKNIIENISNLSELRNDRDILVHLFEEIKRFLKNVKLSSIFEGFKDNLLSYNPKKKSLFVLNALTSKTIFSIEDYLDFLYLFAIFTIADRVSASYNGPKEKFINYFKSIISELYQVDSLDTKKLENYIESLPKDREIDTLREKAREEIISNFREGGLYFIELPTGLGKTLTSLFVALKINNFPIIYSLPFLSIIEHVQKVFYSIYKENVTTLHHISPLTKEIENPDEFIRKIILPYQIRTLTITTHERLRRMLFLQGKSDIILFPFLVKATWIIDEIQLWPLDELKPLEELINQLVRQFGTKFIIMSATIPAIEIKDKIDLVKNKEKYYQSLNRYIIKNCNLSIDDEKFKEKIFKEVLNLIKQKKRVGILVNTVQNSLDLYYHFKKGLSNLNLTLLRVSVKEKDSLVENIIGNPLIFEEIKEILQENSLLDPKLLVTRISELNAFLVFINGRIPSLYKRRVIKWLDKLKEKSRLIIISTQSLEAGVDIDLDVIFREEDTLDSIIQTAGRANRNGLKEQGIVYLVKSSKSSKFFKLIRGMEYDWIRPYIEKIFNKSENQLYSITKEWYKYLREKIVPSDRKEILDAIREFNFEKIRKLYVKPTIDYFFCEGNIIYDILENKRNERPKDYEKSIEFSKKFGFNIRTLLLYKGEYYENEKDIIKEIEDLICPHSIVL